MKYKVVEMLKAKTLQGEIQLQTGQIITLPLDKAIKLLNEGKIAPLEKIILKVYSEILETYLWVVFDEKDMETLRSQDIKETIYTDDEIRKLKGIDKESLKVLHKVKEVFENSKIEQVIIKEDSNV